MVGMKFLSFISPYIMQTSLTGSDSFLEEFWKKGKEQLVTVAHSWEPLVYKLLKSFAIVRWTDSSFLVHHQGCNRHQQGAGTADDPIVQLWSKSELGRKHYERWPVMATLVVVELFNYVIQLLCGVLGQGWGMTFPTTGHTSTTFWLLIVPCHSLLIGSVSASMLYSSSGGRFTSCLGDDRWRRAAREWRQRT